MPCFAAGWTGMLWLAGAAAGGLVSAPVAVTRCQRDCTVQQHLPCLLEKYNDDCPFENVDRTLWPGVPRELSVHGYHNTPRGTSLNISWYPPYDASIHHLEGFEVLIQYFGQLYGQRQCFTLRIQKANWTMADVEQEFYLDCIHEVEDEVNIQVYSLPRMRCQSDECRPNPPKAPTVNYSPPKLPIPVPADWLTRITARTNPQSETLRVQYTPAPPIYNFTTYKVKISNITVPRNRSVVREVDLPRSSDSHTFHGITPGLYEIWVQPVDEYRMVDPCRCVCKKSFKSCPDYVGGCGMGCMITAVRVTMNQTGAAWPSPSPGETSTNTENAWTHPVIIGVTLGVIGVVVMVTVAVFLLHKQWKRYIPNPGLRGDGDAEKGDGDAEKTETHPMLPDPSSLTRKDVFVIISCGDERHQRVAGWFCLFLEGCCCSVKHNLRYSSLSSAPCQRDLQQADKVIIINSRDAFHKFRGWKTSKREAEDRFTTSITLVRAMWREDSSAICRTAVVRFPYTTEEHVIKELVTEGVKSFKLMAEIHRLLCFIHDVDKLPEDLERDLEWDSKDVEENYPSVDSGVGMDAPEFIGPKQHVTTDTATIKSSDIMGVLDKINASYCEKPTLSFGSDHEQRLYAYHAMQEESNYLGILRGDLKSVNTDQSLAF